MSASKQRPTDEELGEMLSAPHFGRSQELPPGDPITPTPMALKIDEVEPYDRNPRVERNSAYEVIKDSIRKRGFRGALSITRRPGAEKRMCSEGGNTTLLAIKELHEETGDERFATILCIFEPWESETEVMIAHLAENDARSDLIFIDKAQGVRNLQRELEAELGVELSQRKLVEVLKERGYPVSRRLLYSMDYAVDTLLPVIPVALRSGMGRPQISAIQKLETSARDIWDCYKAGDEALFKAVFTEALAGCDGADWDFAPARRAVEEALAERCNCEVRHIGIEMGSRLSATKRLPITERPLYKEPAQDGKQEAKKQPKDPAPAEEPGRQQNPPPVAPGAGGELPGSTGMAPEVTGIAAKSPAEPDLTGTMPALTGLAAGDQPTDIQGLRRNAYDLAKQLAERNGMEFIPLYAPLGCGYLVSDAPPFECDPRENVSDETIRMSQIWWHLMACSETENAPVTVVQKLLLPSSATRQMVETGSVQALDGKILITTPSASSYSLWSKMDDTDWQTLVAMMNTYRTIKKLVAEQSLELWRMKI